MIQSLRGAVVDFARRLQGTRVHTEEHPLQLHTVKDKHSHVFPRVTTVRTLGQTGSGQASILAAGHERRVWCFGYEQRGPSSPAERLRAAGFRRAVAPTATAAATVATAAEGETLGNKDGAKAYGLDCREEEEAENEDNNERRFHGEKLKED